MEPTYRKGDLVIARVKTSYEVDDVVAYLPDIGQEFPVIHRIVAVEDGAGYVTQGDNRSEPDGWLATDTNIFGAAWLRIPGGGKLILFMREPGTWLAVALACVGLALISEGKRRLTWTHRGRRRQSRGDFWGRYAAAAVVLLVTLLALSIGRVNAGSLTVDGGVLQALEGGTAEQSTPSTTTTAANPDPGIEDTTTTQAPDMTPSTAGDPTATTTTRGSTTTTAAETTTSTTMAAEETTTTAGTTSTTAVEGTTPTTGAATTATGASTTTAVAVVP
jgi:signal peptidase I